MVDLPSGTKTIVALCSNGAVSGGEPAVAQTHLFLDEQLLGSFDDGVHLLEIVIFHGELSSGEADEVAAAIEQRWSWWG